MDLRYAYPAYKIDFTEETAEQCRNAAFRLLKNVGLTVAHDSFLDNVRNAPGIKIDGHKVRFEESLVKENWEKIVSRSKPSPRAPKKTRTEVEWQVSTGGYSINVIDIETDAIRPATCKDLRDLIKLAHSLGIGGDWPVTPQDLPPLMRDIAVFKICWESSDSIRVMDYQDERQAPYVYEMHQVMGKSFTVLLCMPQNLMIDPNTISAFLKFHPLWKKGGDINFSVLDYQMLGILKPITVTGCATLTLANRLGLHTLFKLFDPELELPVGAGGGGPSDLRGACWAWGHPRGHLLHFLSSRIMPRLVGWEPDSYEVGSVLLESSSCAADAQAAIERMGVAMVAAMQGARRFGGAGNLCVDDLFSGTQLVIDVEIVDYVREVIESFDPHPDILSTDNLYETIESVCLGKELFISCDDTVRKFRNILPSSNRLIREKLASWLSHKKLLVDRAKEEAVERIRNQEPFHLTADKQKQLDEIYERAEAELGGLA